MNEETKAASLLVSVLSGAAEAGRAPRFRRVFAALIVFCIYGGALFWLGRAGFEESPPAGEPPALMLEFAAEPSAPPAQNAAAITLPAQAKQAAQSAPAQTEKAAAAQAESEPVELPVAEPADRQIEKSAERKPAERDLPKQTAEQTRPKQAAEQTRPKRAAEQARPKPQAARPKAAKRSQAESQAAAPAVSAKQGQNFAAPRNSQTDGLNGRREQNWADLVYRKIQRTAQYMQRQMPSARGAALVAFTYDGSGVIGAVALARSSGNAQTDALAVRIVRQASPLPPPPQAGRKIIPVRIR